MVGTHSQSTWPSVSLSDLCEKTSTINPGTRPSEFFQYVDVSSVSNEAFKIVGANRLLGKDAPSRARQLIENEDVIFATVRPALRRVAMVPLELHGQVCSTGFCVLRANKQQLVPRFLYYFLLSEDVSRRVEALQTGATYPAINDGDLFRMAIPLPSPAEQRAIAHVLQTVQKAKETRQRELALEQERKAALMEHLFTHGTRGEPTRQSPIGELPESWSLARLESLYETQLGKMLSQKARKGTNPKPYLRNANVQWGTVDVTDLYEMDFGEAEQKKFALREGDLLVCEGGEIGRTALWNGEIGECYFQKAIHRVRPRSADVVPEFLRYWMEWGFRLADVYGVTGTQTTIAHLPQEKLEQIIIPHPPKCVQQEISSALSASDAVVTAVQDEIDILDELFAAALDELMNGRLNVAALIDRGSNA